MRLCVRTFPARLRVVLPDRGLPLRALQSPTVSPTSTGHGEQPPPSRSHVVDHRSPSFEDLREAVRCLALLMEDPQPGFMTWCLMYGRHMQVISKYWTEN